MDANSPQKDDDKAIVDSKNGYGADGLRVWISAPGLLAVLNGSSM